MILYAVNTWVFFIIYMTINADLYNQQTGITVHMVLQK